MKTRLLGLVALLVWLAATQARAEDDWQYWSRLNLKIHNGEKFDFALYSEGWFRDDAERLELFLISPRLTYHLHKNINLGLNYTYLGFRGASLEDFLYQHRAEGEINPYWTFSNGIKFTTRNRFEYRWIENSGWNNTRMRNRFRLTFPTKGMGPMTSIFADTEFFYNFKKSRHEQQRTTPFGVNFKVTEPLGFQVFWLIHHVQGSSDWYSNQVLGTMFTYTF